MSEFVDRFLAQSLVQEVEVSGKAVKFLPESMGGQDCAGTAHLGLAEHKCQDRDVQVHHSDAKDSPGIRPDAELHSAEDFGGVVLLALSMEGETGIDAAWQDLARHAKDIRQRRGEFAEKAIRQLANREQLQ
jgi:hypothetical protein